VLTPDDGPGSRTPATTITVADFAPGTANGAADTRIGRFASGKTPDIASADFAGGAPLSGVSTLTG
jgi:hypothetical protein